MHYTIKLLEQTIAALEPTKHIHADEPIIAEIEEAIAILKQHNAGRPPMHGKEF
jgi:hypothetical protein